MIARFIQAELEEANGVLELQRSDLAQRFGCVPSQINYVMSTRFSPEHGYIVESRRGGGGYIRITRVQVDRHTLLMHVINSVGDTLDLASARAILSNLVQSQAVERNVAQTLLWAVSDNSLRSVPKDRRDNLRVKLPCSTAAANASSFFVSMCASRHERISWSYYTTYIFPRQERNSMHFAQFSGSYPARTVKFG